MNNKKKESKKTSGGVIALIIIALLSAVTDGLSFDGGVASVFGVIFSIVFFFFVIWLIAKVGKKAKAGAQTDSKAAPAKKPAAPIQYQKEKAAYNHKKAEKPVFEQTRKYYDSDCETMMSVHDHNRRIEQLDGFLKNGLIEKREYDILKEKYFRR